MGQNIEWRPLFLNQKMVENDCGTKVSFTYGPGWQFDSRPAGHDQEQSRTWSRIMDIGNYIVSIVISLTVGLGGFLLAYKIFDWLTPGVHFGDQLKADNRSVAIFLAGLFIGLGLLLGNAVK
jgi:hypothetical protein